jgi:two-component sensor histidine kinase
VKFLLSIFIILFSAELFSHDGFTVTEILDVPENFTFKNENINILNSLASKSWDNIDKRGFKVNEIFWLKLSFPQIIYNKNNIMWKASQLYSVESYVIENDKVIDFQKTGFEVPYNEKRSFSTDLIIDLSKAKILTNTTVFLKLHVSSKNPYLPRMLTSKEVTKYSTWDIIILTSYVSTLLILALYQLSVYFYIRDRASLDYAIFCLGMLMPAMARGGYLDLIMAAYNIPISISKYLVYLIALAFYPAVIFTRSYFNTRERFPKMDVAFRVQIWLFSFGYIYAISAGKTDLLWKLAPVFNLIASLIVVGFAAYATYKKEIGAAYYCLAWTGFLFGVSYFNLATVGVITMPSNMRYITSFAGMYEAILMSIGLSYRLKKFRDMEANAEVKKVENQTLHLMLRILSHDVANPLTVIKMTVKSLKNRFSSELEFAKIEKGIDFITNVTDTVRTYESIEAGKIKFSNSSADLIAATKYAVHIFENKAQDKNIKIEFEHPERVSAICVDQKMLQTNVIPNLCSNAIKFSHPNSQIKISIIENETNVIFSVKDFGVGIPLEIIDDIFDMQSGCSRKGTQEESGTGFGLPLTQKIVNLFMGRIVVDSQSLPDNHGTKISIFFKKYVKENEYKIGNVA